MVSIIFLVLMKSSAAHDRSDGHNESNQQDGSSPRCMSTRMSATLITQHSPNVLLSFRCGEVWQKIAGHVSQEAAWLKLKSWEQSGFEPPSPSIGIKPPLLSNPSRCDKFRIGA